MLRPVARTDGTSVWLARDPDLEREVVVKEVSALRSTDHAMVQRFLQESRRAGAMSHPNIVGVHDYFVQDGTPCLAMEYMPCGSLRCYGQGLDLAQIVGVLEGVLGGLAHAELRGVVHRNLKPENVMVTAEGRVKIADFGIATATHAVCTWAGIRAPRAATGTEAYAAPELTGAHPVGPWTDLYSVGVIAHELLVGRPPSHEGEPRDTILDPTLSGWVEDLLAPDPHRRTSSAYVAWDSLEEIAL
ncbi:MAG TPA: serine/threonine-protein kinase, partial [Solirubrobacteraceae bacterium]|nr:serine/threonine-protein kinase [Solirubrobacteraceae bacterium]